MFKRSIFVFVLLFVFVTQLLAGFVPVSGYAGCDGPGDRAFQDTVTQVIICCHPDIECPADGPEGRRGMSIGDVTTILITKLFTGILIIE